MSAITLLGSVGFAITLPILLILSGQDSLAWAGYKMAWVLVLGESIVFLIKRLVHRPRPFSILAGIINRKPTKCPYSLPSGHTCAAFSQALVLASAFPALSIVFLVLAVLVGISRVYLGVHYPTDVAVGGLTAHAAFWLVHLWI